MFRVCLNIKHEDSAHTQNIGNTVKQPKRLEFAFIDFFKKVSSLFFRNQTLNFRRKYLSSTMMIIMKVLRKHTPPSSLSSSSLSRIMDTALKQIQKALKPTWTTNNQSTSTAFLHYTQATWLTQQNAGKTSVILPPRKIHSYLPPVTDALRLKTPGVYSIPCERSKVYIGQIGHTSKLESKNTRDIQLAQIIQQ